MMWRLTSGDTRKWRREDIMIIKCRADERIRGREGKGWWISRMEK